MEYINKVPLETNQKDRCFILGRLSLTVHTCRWEGNFAAFTDFPAFNCSMMAPCTRLTLGKVLITLAHQPNSFLQGDLYLHRAKVTCDSNSAFSCSQICQQHTLLGPTSTCLYGMHYSLFHCSESFKTAAIC